MIEPILAQKIADEVMNGLGYNINVMDSQGIIIGSGNKERIGFFHELACQAITDRRIYEVNRVEAESYTGVCEGINLPIFDQSGQVLGAIGITGDPDQVRNISQLVRTTAQLIIEHERTLSNNSQNFSDRDSFVSTLLGDNPDYTDAELYDWGSRIGYDLKIPRIACLLVFPKSDYVRSAIEPIKRSNYHQQEDIIHIMDSSSILVFKTLDDYNPWCIESTICSYYDDICTQLNELSEGMRMYVGLFHRGLSGFRASYDEAVCLAHSTCSDSSPIHFGHRWQLPILYRRIKSDYCTDTLDPVLSYIHNCFGHGFHDLMLTLRCLYLYNMSNTTTAEALHVHKNTIIFRKQKLADLLQLDLKNNHEAISILRIMVYHYFQTISDEGELI